MIRSRSRFSTASGVGANKTFDTRITASRMSSSGNGWKMLFDRSPGLEVRDLESRPAARAGTRGTSWACRRGRCRCRRSPPKSSARTLRSRARRAARRCGADHVSAPKIVVTSVPSPSTKSGSRTPSSVRNDLGQLRVLARVDEAVRHALRVHQPQERRGLDVLRLGPDEDLQHARSPRRQLTFRGYGSAKRVRTRAMARDPADEPRASGRRAPPTRSPSTRSSRAARENTIPRWRIPDDEMLPETAYQIIHDELLPRRQRPPEPRDVRHHVDGAARRRSSTWNRSTRT